MISSQIPAVFLLNKPLLLLLLLLLMKLLLLKKLLFAPQMSAIIESPPPFKIVQKKLGAAHLFAIALSKKTRMLTIILKLSQMGCLKNSNFQIV